MATTTRFFIIGSSPGLRRALDQARRAAPFEVPVLLQGETGTGKEGLAHFIHDCSDRFGPLVKVNCALLGEGVGLDEALFGVERTAHERMRHGLFEEAHRGTLFLDEVGDLSLAGQARLLRVLEEGVVRRVGSRDPISVDVRVVAATHKHLDAMVADGSLRRDLWYRLAGLVITLPPLRDRGTDVFQLAQHFLRSEKALKGREMTRLARLSLAGRAWPGNVRELRQLLIASAILEDGPLTLGAHTVGADERVVRLLGRPKSSGQLRKETSIARSTLNRLLLTLEREGRVVRAGVGRATMWSAA